MIVKAMTRTTMWVVFVLVITAMVPATAAAEYGSEQKSVRSHSLSCGHLGTSCERAGKAKKATKKAKRNRKARKACRARSTRKGSVRAYAALPRDNRHVQHARCRR